MTTFSDMPPTTVADNDVKHIHWLEREIRNQHGGLMSALDNRKYHPTFGVTKASLWQRLHHLEGMLYAYFLATGGRHVDVTIGAREVAYKFGLDVVTLHIAIKRA